MIARLLVLLGSFWVTESFAFTCYLTLVKDSCWTNYDVTVVVVNSATHQEVLKVEIPKGQSWIRQPFTCQPKQKLTYTATFNPIIWQSEAGKVYAAKSYWLLPAAIASNQSAWEVSVCYPAAFASVPYPPDAKGNCACDFASIPAIPPARRSTSPVLMP